MKKIDQRDNHIQILYEDNHIIVCIKQEGILSQKDETNDIDMLSIINDYLKVKYNKPGDAYVGLVHRLDRRVSGVMVFAKTSKAASRISEQIRNNQFEKRYLAIASGYIENSGILKNNLKKINNEAVESIDGKECLLKYDVLNHFNIKEEVFSLLDIKLLTGRFNQIRKQMQIINHSLINDFKYGYIGVNHNDHIGLFCIEITLFHPITKEKMIFKYDEIIEKINDNDYWNNYFEVKNEK